MYWGNSDNKQFWSTKLQERPYIKECCHDDPTETCACVLVQNRERRHTKKVSIAPIPFFFLRRVLKPYFHRASIKCLLFASASRINVINHWINLRNTDKINKRKRKQELAFSTKARMGWKKNFCFSALNERDIRMLRHWNKRRTNFYVFHVHGNELREKFAFKKHLCAFFCDASRSYGRSYGNLLIRASFVAAYFSILLNNSKSSLVLLRFNARLAIFSWKHFTSSFDLWLSLLLQRQPDLTFWYESFTSVLSTISFVFFRAHSLKVLRGSTLT